MRCLVFTRPNGGVSIAYPAPQARREGEREADFERRIFARTRAVLGVQHAASAVVAVSDVPVDRGYRDAWVRGGKGVAVDMPRARAIQLARIRRARQPVLAALDIAYQRADEAGDAAEKQRIAARKRSLRDLPETVAPALEAAATPEALASVWPEDLDRA